MKKEKPEQPEQTNTKEQATNKTTSSFQAHGNRLPYHGIPLLLADSNPSQYMSNNDEKQQSDIARVSEKRYTDTKKFHFDATNLDL
ncbi:hypothetical protein KSZ_71140 [Dictyobacter formicarum]|uniref:Uncharacterized protein n=1 Tax=Dictyobacter formicarum TaxID=2778368 RepID=A0ABQ3VU72_9CHLR|nr:hypothetical protein KSZ_71140 [Dictyobacter formicarum]